MPPLPSLIGRERELAQLTAFLDSPAELPRAVLIEGEAGMGKTSVWEQTVEAARERSYRVLRAQPAEAESGLSFSGLADLLEPLLDDVLPQLPPPQREALEAALLLRENDKQALDQRAIGTATLGALRAAALDDPLLVAVDDVQWLDRATFATLAYALRRLRTEPVAGLFAMRYDPTDKHARAPTSWLPTTTIELSPLSMGATHALVFSHLNAVMPRPALRRLHSLSRGNPFYALELTRAWQSGTFRLNEAEALPPDLAGLLGSRIAAQPPATRHALAIAAQMSRPTLRTLTKAAGADAAGALEMAASAGIVEIGGDEIRFSHPLLAASAYTSVTSSERRQIHARLAQLAGDPDERARHLAISMTDSNAGVAADVEAAAEATFKRGAPATAADLMAEASRLTPVEDEADRRRRSLAEAEYRFEAGETDRADELVATLIEESEPGPERAGTIARLARFRHFGEDIPGSVALLRQALDEANGDPRLSAQIEEGLTWGLLLMREDLAGAERHAASAVRNAERLGDDVLLAEALAALAVARVLVGKSGRDAIERALALEPATLGLRVLRQPSFALGYVLSAADELGAARDVFKVLLGRAEDQGDDSALAPVLSHLSLIECLCGDLARAVELADEAHDVALQSGQVPSQAAALGRKAICLAMQGEAEGATDAARGSLRLAVGGEYDPTRPELAAAGGGELAIWALGHSQLAANDHANAERYLGPLTTYLLDAGVREPGEVRCLGDTVEALVNLGRLAEAEKLVRELEEMAKRSRRASVTGTAHRSRALLNASSGDVAGALQHADRAVNEHRTAELPLELARSLLVLGSTQRRARLKRGARESLEESVAIAERLGARGWVTNASQELDRVGGRGGPRTDLTPAEQRAAHLVADGHSNKEIAALMYVSPKTVEANLSRVYAKLGVGSRTELVRYLADHAETT